MEVLLSDAGGYNIGGLALKSKGMSGSDSLGFAALPAGVYQDGEFDFDGSRAYFWSSKSRNSNYACGLRLNRGDEDAAVQCDSKNSGFSVRCLKVSDEGSVDVSSSSVAIGNGSSSSRNGTATTLKDPRDGQVYKIAKIGYQTWMTQNLNYKTTDSYCFDNSSANCKKLGRLYEWNAAVDACPDGWRLPTKEDFERLVAGAGGTSSAGTLLKSRKGWSLDGNGKDSLGFSALPAGDCGEGKFYDYGKFANFWSATEYRSGSAYLLNLASNSDEAKVGTFGKRNGFSIRCLENNGEDSVFSIMDLDNYKAVVGGGVGVLEDSRDGHAYKTVQIGGQIWMAQNLNYPVEGSYCSELSDYDCQKYGRLYQWKSAMEACPSGWRLPTREDFERLLYLVGGKTYAGKMLKSSREWIFNGNGRGAYGFDVYPAGSVANGNYGNEGSEAFFWSSSEDDDNFAYSLGLFSYTDYAFQNSSWKNDGLSVRCISNSSEATR